MSERFVLGDRYKRFPHEVIIWHATAFGGAFSDHKYWMAEKADDQSYVDYNSMENLVAQAKKDKLPYVVLALHRDGSCSVKQSSANESEASNE